MIGAEPTDTMSALHAEIAECPRETPHPVRDFRVRVKHISPWINAG